MTVRVATACALVALVLTSFACATSASANTITTVAGGGAVTPLDYLHFGYSDPLTYNLPAPEGIAWSGAPSGLYYVVLGDGKCVQLWQEFRPDSTSYGMAIEGGTWENCGVQAGGYPTPAPAHNVRLDNPCCVTSNLHWDPLELDTSVGPLVASSGSGHVDFYSWPYNGGNSGVTKAGSTSPTDCNSLTLQPVNNVSPTTAQFCTISGLAEQYTPPYNYAIVEHNRGPNTGVISFVDNSGPLVKTVAITSDAAVYTDNDLPNRYGPPAWDRLNRLIVSDSVSAIYLITQKQDGSWNAPARIAGQAGGQGGFAGDGGPQNSANFSGPTGLAVGFDNALYVADTNNCRIRKIDQVSTADAIPITTIAGNGCSAGAALGDGGPSTSANLDHPVGVAMAPVGLLISDTDHNRVRLVDRTSIIDAPAVTADNTPTFDIRSLDTPSHILCKVDDVGVPCGGIGPLGDGPHTLQAWENGNAADQPDPPDPTPAVTSFSVDTAGPTGVALSSPAPDAAGVPVDTAFGWSPGTDAIAGVDHYELWINGAKDRDVPLSACAGDSCVAKSAQPLRSGNNTWQVRPVDKLGNTTATDTRSLTAGGAPHAAFTISPNPALAGRSVTFDAGTSSDESGIARYEWDLDGDGTFETDAGPSPATTRLYTAPTSITIRLRVTDGTGDQSTAEQALKVTQQPGTQSLLGVTINNGAQYTRTPDVTLNVKAPSNANAFVVSNDGGFLAPATFPAAATLQWKLDSSGPERLPKTVYLRFLLGPIVSDNYTDDIILDEVPPTVQQAALVPSPGRGKAASAAKLSSYKLKIKAKDSNSGVGKVQVTADKKKPGKLLAYRTKLTLKAASQPKFLRAQDKAGNFSAWKKLR